MKQNKLKIAITGGIGSGKSTACEIINNAGYPVYSCDATYSKLFDGGLFTERFVECFGEGILDADGKPSRKKISGIVFYDDEKLKLLNEITHPAIFEKMFEDAQNERGKFCFFEVPLLFEGGYEKLFDKVVIILRDRKECVRSVRTRDGIGEEEVIARINKQYKYEINNIAQYYVIHNNGNIDDLSAKINKILLEITNI